MLRIQLLGHVRAWRDDTEIALGPGQQSTLFGLLAHASGRVVGWPEIIDTLWPTQPPSAAVNVVQTYVKRLRQLLEPGRPARAASGVLETAGGGYRMTSDHLDVAEFRLLVAQSQLTSDVADRLVLLHEALALWSGKPFAGTRLADSHLAQSLTTEYERALCSHAAAALECGRAEDAAPALEVAAREAPLNEKLHAALMLVQHASGRRGAAFATYHALRSSLREELGVDPGAEVMAAHAALLSSEGDTLAVASRPVVTPRQTPADVPYFCGRAAEVERLTAALTAAGPGLRMGAVTGMPGVGKSALVVHVANLLAADPDSPFPDGHLYVDLTGSGAPVSPTDALGGLLHALGVPGRDLPPDPGQRAALFRSRTASRRMLVVLDDAATEAQVRPLLPGGTGCAVLLTSRRRLAGLSATVSLDLGPLPFAEGARLLTRAIGAERAERDLASLEGVVRSCCGLPLALRAAGARIAARPSLPLSVYAAELADGDCRLDHLEEGDLSVRESLASSYASLSPTAREAYLLLGEGRLPHAVCSSVVDELVGAHLVSVDWSRTTSPSVGVNDLVRLHAIESAAALRAARLQDAEVCR